jgi:hypothetical protein
MRSHTSLALDDRDDDSPTTGELNTPTLPMQQRRQSFARPISLVQGGCSSGIGAATPLWAPFVRAVAGSTL